MDSTIAWWTGWKSPSFCLLWTCSLITFCKNKKLFPFHHLHNIWDLQCRHHFLLKSWGSKSQSLLFPLAEMLFQVSSLFSYVTSVLFQIIIRPFGARLTKLKSIWCMGTPHRPALFCTVFRSFLGPSLVGWSFLTHVGFKADEKEEVVVSCLGSACLWFLLE